MSHSQYVMKLVFILQCYDKETIKEAPTTCIYFSCLGPTVSSDSALRQDRYCFEFNRGLWNFFYIIVNPLNRVRMAYGMYHLSTDAA